jgi:ComF family protein
MPDPENVPSPGLKQALAKTAVWVKSVYDDFKEFLSPSACLCCGRERDFADPFLCPTCIDNLKRKNIGDGPICPFCGRPAGTRSSCELCRGPRPLDFYYWGIYDEELKECILQFKFRNALELGKKLSLLAASTIGERLANNEYDMIVSVPLHKARERERRFNQSDIIARTISKALDIPICPDALIRRRATYQQSKLAEKDRWNNVKDAFVISSDSREFLTGKRVLLIDDIVTTGATIYEASRPLLETEIGRLDIFALAYAK